MASVIVANEIKSFDGVGRPEGAVGVNELTVGKIIMEFDSTTYSTSSNTFVDFKVWANQTGFSSNSLIEFFYHVPCRNDDATSWGGAYIEPWLSFNNGSTWLSLGHGGYDGGVMLAGSASIHYYSNQMIIDPAQTAAYSVRLKFRFRRYNTGTSTVNGSHDINGGLGRNLSYLSNGNSHQQHWMHYTIKEWIKN